MDDLNPPVIVGEREAGRAATVRKRLMMLVGDIAEHTFDLADLLAEAADGSMFRAWGYDSIGEYADKELGLKERKAQYLIRITKVSKAVGLHRTQYESAGISKLREITRLDPQGSYFNPETKEAEPLNEHIVNLIAKAEEMTGAEILDEVRHLLGQTGENRPVTKMMQWTESTYLNVILPAQELARRRLGSAGRDKDTGNAVEYSDSVVEEVIHADFLSDSNNYPEPEEVHLVIEPDDDTSEPLGNYIPTEAE